jgi:hypothetical protein
LGWEVVPYMHALRIIGAAIMKKNCYVRKSRIFEKQQEA